MALPETAPVQEVGEEDILENLAALGVTIPAVTTPPQPAENDHGSDNNVH